MKYRIYELGIMVIVISFLGFVVENIWLLITKGYINNRNMNFPFLLGYGLLVLMMYICIGTPENLVFTKKISKKLSKAARYLIYFLCAMIIVSLAEIILGKVVERLCGIEYWNYSNIPLHITKYTSVPTSAAFALLITFFMGVCFEPVMALILKVDPGWIQTISVVLLFFLFVDFLASFGIMIKRRNFYLKWKVFFR